MLNNKSNDVTCTSWHFQSTRDVKCKNRYQFARTKPKDQGKSTKYQSRLQHDWFCSRNYQCQRITQLLSSFWSKKKTDQHQVAKKFVSTSKSYIPFEQKEMSYIHPQNYDKAFLSKLVYILKTVFNLCAKITIDATISACSLSHDPILRYPTSSCPQRRWHQYYSISSNKEKWNSPPCSLKYKKMK